MLSLHSVVFREQEWSVVVILVLSLVQLTQELWQAGGQGFKNYFTDIWNLIDNFSLLSVWLYCGFYLADI